MLRVVVADRKVAFILSMHGLIDLAAILPFYIAPGVDSSVDPGCPPAAVSPHFETGSLYQGD